ncbi:MAG: NAD(P)-binding protein, partial [Cyanobacteria bacterium]|nr:NAD(P)-binding protein [Cyanobacteriota bacterium]
MQKNSQPSSAQTFVTQNTTKFLLSSDNFQLASVHPLFGASAALKKKVEQHYPVIVVGAGLAGLTAMHELVKKQNVPAILIESQKQIGGNSKSSVSPHGVKHPTGATIFIPGNEANKKLWKEIGVTLDPTMELKPEIFVMNDERFTAFNHDGKALEFPPEKPENIEAANGFQKLLAVLKQIAQKIKSAPVIPIQEATAQAFRKWDKINMFDFL